MSRASRLVVGPLVGLSAVMVVLAGCTSASSPATTEAAASGELAAAVESPVRVVEPAAAAALLEAEPQRVVVDVRTPAEFAAGHLEGALLVDYNAPDFAQRIAELDPDGSYLIYCRSGNRSAGARQVMDGLGFTDVVDVAGGIVAWQQAGLSVSAP